METLKSSTTLHSLRSDLFSSDRFWTCGGACSLVCSFPASDCSIRGPPTAIETSSSDSARCFLFRVVRVVGGVGSANSMLRLPRVFEAVILASDFRFLGRRFRVCLGACSGLDEDIDIGLFQEGILTSRDLSVRNVFAKSTTIFVRATHTP